MLIDASLLRRAKLENIERLATSLGVELPRRKRDAIYANQLVSAVASKIRRDSMLDELRRITSPRSQRTAPSTSPARSSVTTKTSSARFRLA
jgi:hypothetical protein